MDRKTLQKKGEVIVERQKMREVKVDGQALWKKGKVDGQAAFQKTCVRRNGPLAFPL